MEDIFYFYVVLLFIGGLLFGFALGRVSSNKKLDEARKNYNTTIDGLYKELGTKRTKVRELQHLEEEEKVRKEYSARRKKLKEQRIQDKKRAEKKASEQVKKPKNKSVIKKQSRNKKKKEVKKKDE